MEEEDTLAKYLTAPDEDNTPAAFNLEQQDEEDTLAKYLPTPEEKKGPAKPQRPAVEDAVPDSRFSISDLKKGQNARDIRAYMVDRMGVDFKVGQGRSDEEVVDAFVNQMRYFNSNIVSTAGEARFIANADEQTKARAAQAYKLYDNLGNLFTGDAGEIFDGIGDYIYSAATDPSNYAGILTGGMAKAGLLGGQQAGKAAVKAAVRTAIKDVGANTALKGEAKRAAGNVYKDVLTRAASQGVRLNKKQKQMAYAAAEREYALFMQARKRALSREAVQPILNKRRTNAILATAGIDSVFAVLQDATLQNTLIDAGAQETYSTLQTGFSSLLGGVSGIGAFVAPSGARKLVGESGLKDIRDQARIKARRDGNLEEMDTLLREVSRKQEAQKAAADFKFTPKQAKTAGSKILEVSRSWKDKVDAGKGRYSGFETPVEIIREVLLGKDGDGKSGLVKILIDDGVAVPKDMRISDFFTNLMQMLPKDQLKQINENIKGLGITLGDTTQVATSIEDLFAKELSRGGQVLQVASQFRKYLDAATVYGDRVINGSITTINEKEAIAENMKRARVFEYGQNVWKRMLVSSPATSAINIIGAAQYGMGQSLADLFASPVHYLAALGYGSVGNKAAAEQNFRAAKVYAGITGQRMRNLMDPYTTKDAYMAFLEQNKDVKKILFETLTGGIERSGKRFGIDPEDPAYLLVERTTDAASMLTGVRAQDTFTKSQMFMTELDKHIRIKTGKTLQETFKDGAVGSVDNDVIGRAVDTTLRSVFSKDYTTDDQLLGGLAKGVENFSSLPLVGTILPFGRFMNNVIATTYQWSPAGALSVMSSLYKKGRGSKQPENISEAFARAAVGTTALALAADFSKEQREKGMGTFDVDLGNGQILDARNTFPFSLWLTAGRIIDLNREGEMVPRELVKDFAAQTAVGQFASDVQFANDIYNIMDVAFNEDRQLGVSLIGSAFAKQGGSILAGFTRPLDAINRMTGLIAGSDVAKDPRQAEGLQAGTIQATRYVDNLIEIFTDKLEGVTGEELRVATREGKIQDPSPLLSVMGIKLKPNRTSTEKAYSMAEMHPWTANERSAIPAYDKIFNEAIAPAFEDSMMKLIQSEEFKKGNVARRRQMLTDTKNALRSDLRKYLLVSGDETTSLMAARKKLINKGDKNVRYQAKQIMREKYDIDADIRDYSERELRLYESLIDYLKL